MMFGRAMGGTMKFEDTLAARLNLMQPSETAIAEFLAAHPPQLSEGGYFPLTTAWQGPKAIA